jgi:hypothetical protein
MKRLRKSLAPIAVASMALAVAAAASLGYTDVRSQAGPIVWREQPRRLATTANLPEALSDEQLSNVLVKLRPRFRRGEIKINYVDHALRCWGLPAAFDDRQSLCGEAMRQLLVDHRAFVDVYGPSTPPLMRHAASGVLVRVQKGPSTSSHVDHTLATLAEIGTPGSFPIATADGPASVRDLLDGALANFALAQPEYEWTALAYLLFAEDPSRPFVAADGQIVSLDDLAERLMRQTLDQGCCYGNHRLYALAVLERLDREADASGRGWLTASSRARLREHLAQATASLISTQSAAGCWEVNGLAPVRIADDEMSPRAGRILMTGHALEFWAMASPEFHPPRETVIRGSQWLVRQVDAMSEKDVREEYTYLSHACRALCLWRGEEPHESWSRLDPLSHENAAAPMFDLEARAQHANSRILPAS